MISIIIPTHNYGKYIGQCLKSIKNQTKKPDEIIVIDDTSTDNTEKKVKKFKSVKYFKVKYCQANRTRNYGFEKTRGQFVIFFDADDYMTKDCLANLHRVLENNPKAAFAYSDQIEKNQHNKKIRKSSPWDYQKLRESNYIAMPALVRRKYFPKFDERLERLQDWDLWLTIGKKAIGIYVPEPLFYRRLHSRGITSQTNLLKADSYIRRKHNLPKMHLIEKIKIALGEAKQKIINDLWSSPQKR